MNTDIQIALLAGDETIDYKVLFCLNKINKNIHIISNDENSILKHSRYKKKFVYIPWSENADKGQSNAEDVKAFCDKNNIDVIFTGDCNSGIFLDRNKEIFSNQKFYPPLDHETLLHVDHKWNFSKTLMREGISTPHTIYLDKPEQVDLSQEAFIEQEIGYPLIAKPALGDDSLGVTKIENFDQLRDHVLGKNSYSELPLIVQQYIEGNDAGYSFLAKDGDVLIQSIQLVINEDELEFRHHQGIEDIGKKIVKLFNYNGAGNIDVRIDSSTGQVYVFELNPRFWRSVTASMWRGANFPKKMLNVTRGQEYDYLTTEGKYTLPGKKIKNVLKIV